MTSPSNRTKAEMSLLKPGPDEQLTCNTALNTALDVKEQASNGGETENGTKANETPKHVFVKAENGVHVVHPAADTVAQEQVHYET